ncbi:MAG: exo-alpha-sialidase [Verrucomicrobia bacterium]|nr:exo-alpha-sialidase [Verrucomicrobiota bacterium]
MIETEGGRLLACWYRGSGERTANDVIIEGAVYREEGDRSEWSAPFVMADTLGLPDCNPVLFGDRAGRIWMFWVVPIANRWENSVLKFRRASRLHEETGRPIWDWQDSIHLVPGPEFAVSIRAGFDELDPSEPLWAEYAKPYSRLLQEAASDPYKRQTGWMTRNHPIILRSGTIVLPLYSDGFNLSMVAYSQDEGETWHAGKPIVGLGPIQPTILQENSGRLVAFHRDSGGPPARVLVSHSMDDGKTWSVARDTDIPNPGSSLEVIRIMDGRWVMIFNRSEAVRDNLYLAVSSDEGQSWHSYRQLEPAPGRDGLQFSYPSIIQSKSGTIHATWSVSGNGGETIFHRIIPLSTLTGGE